MVHRLASDLGGAVDDYAKGFTGRVVVEGPHRIHNVAHSIRFTSV